MQHRSIKWHDLYNILETLPVTPQPPVSSPRDFLRDDLMGGGKAICLMGDDDGLTMLVADVDKDE